MGNRFKKGSGKYTCRACLKETRETGHEESEVELCAKCLWENYAENARSDHGEDSPQYKGFIYLTPHMPRSGAV